MKDNYTVHNTKDLDKIRKFEEMIIEFKKNLKQELQDDEDTGDWGEGYRRGIKASLIFLKSLENKYNLKD